MARLLRSRPADGTAGRCITVGRNSFVGTSAAPGCGKAPQPPVLEESSCGSPQEEDIQEQDEIASRSSVAALGTTTEPVSSVQRREAAPPGLRSMRLVRRPSSPRHRLNIDRRRG